MGRSVGTTRGAHCVVYLEHGCDGEDCEWQWKDFMDYVKDSIKAAFPSFVDADLWIGSEGHIILSNMHSDVVLYEYCGMTSINLSANESYYPELADHWCSQITERFEKLFPERYYRQGTFSNGVSVYGKVGA